MAEPDGVMPGPEWPAEWGTGWVTWHYSDMNGDSPEGDLQLTLSAQRAVAIDSQTTVSGGVLLIPLVAGRPSGPHAVVNDNGLPVVEVPLGLDPEVVPAEIKLLARESWTGTVSRHLVTAAATFNDPLWLTGDLVSVSEADGVSPKFIWTVPLEASGPPAQALVGDWILYEDTGLLAELTSE